MRTALLAFCACVPLFPQGSTGRIDGTITDSSGLVIVGAKVTVTDIQRGSARTLTTDSAGAYAAPDRRPHRQGSGRDRRGPGLCAEAAQG